MKYKLLVRVEAELEISHAVEWYEDKQNGLGSDFLLSIDAAIESILRAPKAYTSIYKNTRRTLLRKFPFGVHYIIEDEYIIILAVFHVSRNPKEWKKRIS